MNGRFYNYIAALSILVVLIAGLNCKSKNIFSIQNCYGGTIDVTIELGPENFDLQPEITNKIENDIITLRLPHSKIVPIFENYCDVSNTGLPFQRLIVIRNDDTTIIHGGDNILLNMDTDVFGRVACPNTLCL